MSRSLSNLRRGLLGIAFAGAMGFGVTQAFATSTRIASPAVCQATGYNYVPSTGCPGCLFGGYCNGVSS
ncbi:MAG: hypothetical protein JO040_01545, partial [Gemmatimonadetes bacterium]|nr:hypothetical protein [Gemmatimonadota bacterium]